MTNQEQMITPPQLVEQWFKEVCKDFYNGGTFIMAPVLNKFGTTAARWGADQALEACVNYVDNNMSGNKARELRAIRRPKSPSLKEQAFEALGYLQEDEPNYQSSFDTIRRALEQLND